MNSLEIGLSGTAEIIVLEKYTARNLGSGSLDVYATPAMIALMEQAASSAVELYLPVEHSTVGTNVNIRHMAATPIGMKVRAIAELIAIENRKLTFKVEAFDEAEKIGEGIHERYIVANNKFLDKLNSKKVTID